MGTRSDTTLDQWLKRLEAQLDLDRLVQDCCQALMNITGADRCSIMVLEADTEELAVRWAQGARVKPYGRVRFRVGEGLCGWVARSQRPMFSFDMARETRFVPSATPAYRFRQVKSICCLPLVVHDRTVGVVNLSSFRGGERFRYCVQQRLPKPFLERLAQVIEQAALIREAETTSRRWRRQVKLAAETVAQVSHEIRTPLTLITEGAQQMLDGLHGTLAAAHRERLAGIKAQADRMLRLVTELLDFSRIEVGKLVLQRQPIELAQVLEEVRAGYEPLAAPRRLVLQAKPTPPVYGDRTRLTQVVENLLTNAIKFTPPEGTITLGLTARGRTAEITISDTGIGISKREQQRLFEKFFQAKKPAALAERGTGLGLAIVKEIVQLHGGTIRVSSEPAQGTTFIVGLPLYSPAFALTEEFRVMRDQAARQGVSLICQLLKDETGSSLQQEETIELLRRHVSREDRVLVNPAGGLVVLSVSDPEGFEAMRRRLQGILSSQPQRVDPHNLCWGWALVPQEGSELNAVLELAHGRFRQKAVAMTGKSMRMK